MKPQLLQAVLIVLIVLLLPLMLLTLLDRSEQDTRQRASDPTSSNTGVIEYVDTVSAGFGMRFMASSDCIAKVIHVEPASPAGRAGVQTEGRLIAVDGLRLANATELLRYLRGKDLAVFTVESDGKATDYPIGREPDKRTPSESISPGVTPKGPMTSLSDTSDSLR